MVATVARKLPPPIRIDETKIMDRPDFSNLSCPAPLAADARVLLGHGSGGKLTADLIAELFVPGYCSDPAAALEDQAIVSLAMNQTDEVHTEESGAGRERSAARVAFTTDSFVVRPLFFPGGDIGRLAINEIGRASCRERV